MSTSSIVSKNIDDNSNTSSDSANKFKTKRTRKKSDESTLIKSDSADEVSAVSSNWTNVNDILEREEDSSANNKKMNLFSFNKKKYTEANESNDSESSQVRSYDDFIQQSVEIGSFLNFNTNSNSKTNKPSTDIKKSSLIEMDDMSSSDVCNNNSNSNASGSSSSGNNAQLVLIKYKKLTDDPTMNSLRANQLQKRREIHSLLLFIFFLFVTIITLSQILVMHSQTNNSNFYQIKLMQEELKLMDASIDKMLKEKHVLPMHIWYALKQYNDNLKRFNSFIDSFNQNNDSLMLFSNLNESYDYYYQNTNDYQSRKIDLESVKSELLNELNNCSIFTNDLVTKRGLFNATLIDSLIKSDTSSQIKDRNEYIKARLDKIYKYLIELLNEFNSNKKSNNQHNEYKQAKSSPSNIDELLNDHLSLLRPVMSTLEQSTQNQHMKCLKTIIFSLFYFFNNKYSNLFENQIEFRKSVVNNYDLINKTLESIKDANNSLINSRYLEIPLRNMKDYLNKYENHLHKNNYFDPTKPMCDPQPPVLCKCFFFYNPN
jgi:hypothetical protein